MINKMLETSAKLKLHSRTCNNDNLWSAYVFLVRETVPPNVGVPHDCKRRSNRATGFARGIRATSQNARRLKRIFSLTISSDDARMSTVRASDAIRATGVLVSRPQPSLGLRAPAAPRRRSRPHP
jgi:hypothetical protein